MDREIILYVRNNIAKGYSKQYMIDALKQYGYSDAVIEDIFKIIESEDIGLKHRKESQKESDVAAENSSNAGSVKQSNIGNEVVLYVKNGIEKGFSKQYMANALTAHGYSEKVIDDIFSIVESDSSNSRKQLFSGMKPFVNIRPFFDFNQLHARMNLILIPVLILVILIIGFIIFNNLFLEDDLESGSATQEDASNDASSDAQAGQNPPVGIEEDVIEPGILLAPDPDSEHVIKKEDITFRNEDCRLALGLGCGEYSAVTNDDDKSDGDRDDVLTITVVSLIEYEMTSIILEVPGCGDDAKYEIDKLETGANEAATFNCRDMIADEIFESEVKCSLIMNIEGESVPINEDGKIVVFVEKIES